MNANQLIDRAAGITRRTARRGERLARWAASFTRGQAERFIHSSRGAKPGMDDATLKAKVETELFRPTDAPKGSVSINVIDGIVQLRGEVKTPKQARDLEKHARDIPEVRGVENLLHLRKTPSPTRTDSPAGVRKRAARSGGPG
jgi:osmotically-inducible protein OsmY